MKTHTKSDSLVMAGQLLVDNRTMDHDLLADLVFRATGVPISLIKAGLDFRRTDLDAEIEAYLKEN